MANRILPGYVAPMGNKYELIVDHDGPTSYNNTGTFSTSGETINAADFGLGGIDFVDVEDLSSDGVNTGAALLVAQSTIAGNIGNAVTSFVLHWFVQAGGAEVANAVNLSTKSLRLKIRGV